MKQVNIHHAKTHLSRLIQRALAGEEIVIAKAGEPLVRLTPAKAAMPGKRKLGDMRGEIWIAEDFDAEDPEINRMFGIQE